MTAEQRSAVYAIAPLVSALLTAFGVVDENQSLAVAGSITGILGLIVAFAHRPTKQV